MLKTLTKLAKKRGSIPVLNSIRIKDGVATATDLDVYVSVPVSGSLDESFTYHAHGFAEGIPFKTEIPASDFPELSKKGRVCGEVDLNAAQIEAFKWVFLAASNDARRYYLNGVYFGAEDIVATDCHRLHSFKHPVKWGLQEQIKKPAAKSGKKAKAAEPAPERTPITNAILPNGAIRTILAMVSETKAKSFSIEFHDTLHFTCRVPGGAVIDGKLIDGTFPDWKYVVPTYDGKSRTVFDPAEIKSIKPTLEIMERVSCHMYGKHVVATKSGKLWLVTHEKPESSKAFSVKMDLPFIAGFNFKYLSEMCCGIMEYGDCTAPFKVTDKRGGVEKMGVLMPLRV